MKNIFAMKSSKLEKLPILLNGPMSSSNGSICNGKSQEKTDTSSSGHKHGYSLLVASLFVAGENAGCALLTLPFMMNQAGWWGLIMILMLGLNAAYAGIVLARCWLILEERWTEFRESCRYPYPAIGMMAFGNKIRMLVTACVQITLIGSMVVILLLAAQLINNVASETTGICFCMWIIILSCILCPLTFFGSPSEFWPAAAGALATTTLAVVLILTDALEDLQQNMHKNTLPAHSDVSFKSLFLAFGTVMFAYGGTASFPTFQNDMKDKRKFPQSVIVGFIALVMLYAPMAVIGYITYGNTVNANVILSLPVGPKKMIAVILMAGHLLFAYLLCASAPMQEIESAMNIPTKFSYRRALIRSFIVFFTMFLALSVPNFGKVLDLIGGSTISMLSFILPPIFYFQLISVKNPEWPERHMPMWEKVVLIQILLVGVFGGIACTYSAVLAIWGENSFTYPCYVVSTCDTGL